jgi:hypothetical protein
MFSKHGKCISKYGPSQYQMKWQAMMEVAKHGEHTKELSMLKYRPLSALP